MSNCHVPETGPYSIIIYPNEGESLPATSLPPPPPPPPYNVLELKNEMVLPLLRKMISPLVIIMYTFCIHLRESVIIMLSSSIRPLVCCMVYPHRQRKWARSSVGSMNRESLDCAMFVVFHIGHQSSAHAQCHFIKSPVTNDIF